MTIKYTGDLIDFFVEEHKVSRVEARAMIDTVLNSIAHQLFDGNDVSIKGFGRFRVVQNKPRISKGFNQTPTQTHPLPRVNFKASNALRGWLKEKRSGK